MKLVNRRSLFKIAAGASVAIPTLATPALSSGKQKLTMVTAWPRAMTPLHNTAERFANRVHMLSDGRLSIEIHAANEKVSALEMLDALGSGTADISHGTAYYWVKKSPAFALFATVPFGMMAAEHQAWLKHGGGQQLWDTLGEQFGVKPFAAGNTGVQTAGWFREQIRTRRDLVGKSVRFPALGGELLRSVGAEPKLTAASDIGPMLQSGELDGAEWISPWVDLQYGMQNHCKYCYYPGVHEPGHTVELNIALDKWRDLDPPSQAIFANAAEAECLAVPTEFAANNAVAVSELIQEHNVEFLRLPNDVVRALRQAAPRVLENFVAGDDFSKKVHDSYVDFMGQLGRWAEFSERAYWRARYT